jgi:hypothetical protein
VLQSVVGSESDVQPRRSVQSSDLHVSPLHDAEIPQVISHAQAVPQLRSVHESRPVHSMAHTPLPHANFEQLMRPEHVMLQGRPAGHVTPLRHELIVEHSTLQSQPSGHLIGPLQAPPLRWQSMLQVVVSLLHDVHTDGHRLASDGGAASMSTRASPGTLASAWGATQKPSIQVRPLAQSICRSHAKSPLRWLTEQPAAASASPRSQYAASFMACLRS